MVKIVLLSLGLVLVNLLVTPKPVAAQTQYGMFYAIWHCRATSPFPIFDTTASIYGQQPWGSIPNYHWSGKPVDGYYCLANNDALLRKHAEQLRDMGMDFVYVDITNWWYTDSPNADNQILNTFPKLLSVWSTVPNAPKIVPFVVVPANANMVDWINTQMNAYPNSRFVYEGKPLLLVANFGGGGAPDATRLNQLRQNYTVRLMWGFYQSDKTNEWAWLQYCQLGFKASKGTAPCNQYVARKPDGSIEQISTTVSYQETLMSKKDTAVPKFYGRTFRRQFEKILANPNVPIVTLNGWNEWIAQRFCLQGNDYVATGCTGAGEIDHYPDGNKVFVDEYEYEYNRDIEPAADQMGSYYSDLTKSCVLLHKSGGTCTATNKNNLCCKDYVGYDFGTPINPSNDGWTASNHLANVTTANGVWQANITGNDPFMYGPANLTFPAGPSDTFKVKMKISSGGTTEGHLFWVTNQSTVFDGNKALGFQTIGDNQWHEYVFGVGWHPGWTGDIKQLRLDPNTNASGAVVTIDYIHLVPYQPSPPVTIPSINDLKTMISNYLGTQDSGVNYFPDGKINSLDMAKMIYAITH